MSEKRRKERRIAVVDDDPGFRKSIGILLENFGFSAALFASAEEFLSESRRSELVPGCLILDIHLEGMSGIELGRYLANTEHPPSVIFITGNDNEASRRAASLQDCTAYLTKPFTAKALVDAIDRALA